MRNGHSIDGANAGSDLNDGINVDTSTLNPTGCDVKMRAELFSASLTKKQKLAY